MFMLAPEFDGRSTRAALYLGMSALVIAIAGGAAAICLGGNLNLVLLAAAAFGIAALAFYGMTSFVFIEPANGATLSSTAAWRSLHSFPWRWQPH
jgi:hypothetical protein